MSMSSHKIKKALGILPEVGKDEDSPKQNTNTIIVEEYIKRYAPADTFGPGVVIITTSLRSIFHALLSTEVCIFHSIPNH